MEELILSNSRLIYKIASYFNIKNKEDLYQVGCIGLIKAYNNYDNNKNTKFSTYAYPYILGEMKKYLREDKGIKISREITQLNSKIEESYIVLTQKLNRTPSSKELSLFLEIDEYLIIEALKSTNALTSLDELIYDNMSLYDTIQSNELDLNTLLFLKEELNNLSELDKKIIELRYFNDLTQQEVSNVLGMSQVQVSRGEQKVLKNLRKNMYN